MSNSMKDQLQNAGFNSQEARKGANEERIQEILDFLHTVFSMLIPVNLKGESLRKDLYTLFWLKCRLADRIVHSNEEVKIQHLLGYSFLKFALTNLSKVDSVMKRGDDNAATNFLEKILNRQRDNEKTGENWAEMQSTAIMTHYTRYDGADDLLKRLESAPKKTDEVVISDASEVLTAMSTIADSYNRHEDDELELVHKLLSGEVKLDLFAHSVFYHPNAPEAHIFPKLLKEREQKRAQRKAKRQRDQQAKQAKREALSGGLVVGNTANKTKAEKQSKPAAKPVAKAVEAKPAVKPAKKVESIDAFCDRVPKLTAKAKDSLKESGLTVEAIAAMESEELVSRKLPGIATATATKLVKAAKA